MDRGVAVLSQQDNLFPHQLLYFVRPPKQLYALGNTSLLQDLSKCFAIVGTRKPTGYGVQVARLFAEQLAKAGMIIVSGMARGIDSIAHEASLQTGGKTIAVLGSGVDVVYPKRNRNLYQRILDEDGLILSEQPCGQEPLKGMFVLRNRIISGISRGVLIVEGSHISGSMITAKYAADQGKDVFVAPMPITSVLSEGPLYLYRNGARMVTHPDEILDEYGLSTPLHSTKFIQHLSEEEKNILEILASQDHNLDSLSKKTGNTVDALTYTITMLELKGLIMKTLMGTYQRIR